MDLEPVHQKCKSPFQESFEKVLIIRTFGLLQKVAFGALKIHSLLFFDLIY